MTRTAAQRAAFAKLQPKTRQDGVGETFTEPELVGKQLVYRKAALIMEYKYSFRSNVDGELYHGGTLVAKGKGVGFALGSAWAWRANELEVVGE